MSDFSLHKMKMSFPFSRFNVYPHSNWKIFIFCIKVENQISTYNPQGFIVAYAVDDETSVVVAEQILTYLKSEDIIENQAVILVANKTDLVRSREVSSNGKYSIIR